MFLCSGDMIISVTGHYTPGLIPTQNIPTRTLNTYDNTHPGTTHQYQSMQNNKDFIKVPFKIDKLLLNLHLYYHCNK